ncbi:DUF2790 domain-containing protein [Pseudomonas vanderleydeniana]|uniref:DUF2790 domain-containing protein n=1 Tax=Pseudomonas vanderleydeniana TaxID=2745495 RepID=A0A9E6TPI5_9PSED|nr:DUF2790 domain-containing protein [Pseudomonas vanderleydeniana]QXI26458.1 DUF2790 domain-containing protein [Pseudomonas vanderleydeniana]
MNIYVKCLTVAAVLFSAQAFALDKKDVAEVIRVDSNPYACGITNAKMTYKTPDGQTKVYDYKTWGNGCAGD